MIDLRTGAIIGKTNVGAETLTLFADPIDANIEFDDHFDSQESELKYYKFIFRNI